jgi:hypothetical protein
VHARHRREGLCVFSIAGAGLQRRNRTAAAVGGEASSCVRRFQDSGWVHALGGSFPACMAQRCIFAARRQAILGTCEIISSMR